MLEKHGRQFASMAEVRRFEHAKACQYYANRGKHKWIDIPGEPAQVCNTCGAFREIPEQEDWHHAWAQILPNVSRLVPQDV